MPLTLQIFGSSTDDAGQFIIDRKNIIIAYSKKVNNADRNRDRLQAALLNTPIVSHVSNDQGFVMTEDPRHDALEHMGEYDRRLTFHVHLIFEEDVNLNHVKMIFNNLNISRISDLLSKECCEHIIETADGYFSELKNSSQAQAIEAEYCQEKEREYKRAEEKALESQPTQNEATPIVSLSPLDDLLSFNSMFSLTMNDSLLTQELSWLFSTQANSAPKTSTVKIEEFSEDDESLELESIEDVSVFEIENYHTSAPQRFFLREKEEIDVKNRKLTTDQSFVAETRAQPR